MLHAGYMSFYLALSIPPLLLYVQGDRRAFEETTLALVVTWVLSRFDRLRLARPGDVAGSVT